MKIKIHEIRGLWGSLSVIEGSMEEVANIGVMSFDDSRIVWPVGPARPTGKFRITKALAMVGGDLYYEFEIDEGCTPLYEVNR